MEISRGRGVLKVKIVGTKYDAKLELTGRTEGAKQKPFHGGSMQGPKLTFLSRRQVVTEIFFSVAIWKNVVAKK